MEHSAVLGSSNPQQCMDTGICPRNPKVVSFCQCGAAPAVAPTRKCDSVLDHGLELPGAKEVSAASD